MTMDTITANKKIAILHEGYSMIKRLPTEVF